MRKRSLLASPLGMIKAKQAFEITGWTQEDLAGQVGLSTRQSIWKFFSGKPIERYLFVQICSKLNLDWQEIATDEEYPKQVNLPGVKVCLGQKREVLRELIFSQCEFLQSSLELNQPSRVRDIYTALNVLPYLTSQRWLEVEDLQKEYIQGHHLHHMESRQPGIEVIANHHKVVIFGKPGSGKTTFLQYLALQCMEGNFQPHLIPVFIPLRMWAARAKLSNNFSLIDYLSHVWEKYQISKEEIDFLATQGHLLVLFDGVDEVGIDEREQIINELQIFTDNYYENSFIITCRTGYSDYYFRGFTYLEIADFEIIQVKIFVYKWFGCRYEPDEAEAKAEQFLRELSRAENQAIKELVVTPLLLSLICSVFEMRANFPSKRTKLYQAGLEILLVRWDQARGVVRDKTYRDLVTSDKIKLLSQIAATTFSQGKIFFEKAEILPIISDYLKTLNATNSDSETLWLESEAVLKSIQLQHGLLVEQAKDIYSFSHLTFQEYLTARKIVATPTGEAINQALEQLAKHLTKPQWREVISMTLNLLPNVDYFMGKLKETVDKLLVKKPRLLQYLNFLDVKTQAVKVNYKLAGVRAFYFNLLRNSPGNLAILIDVNLAGNLAEQLALDLLLARVLSLSDGLLKNPDIKQILNLGFALDFDVDFEFKQEVENLKNQLLESVKDKNSLLTWWQNNGADWLKNFREVVIKHRYFGEDWQFNLSEQALLETYCSANYFLVECLNSDCQITPQLRQDLENGLLVGAVF